jgi:hypothetical protein
MNTLNDEAKTPEKKDLVHIQRQNEQMVECLFRPYQYQYHDNDHYCPQPSSSIAKYTAQIFDFSHLDKRSERQMHNVLNVCLAHYQDHQCPSESHYKHSNLIRNLRNIFSGRQTKMRCVGCCGSHP